MNMFPKLPSDPTTCAIVIVSMVVGTIGICLIMGAISALRDMRKHRMTSDDWQRIITIAATHIVTKDMSYYEIYKQRGDGMRVAVSRKIETKKREITPAFAQLYQEYLVREEMLDIDNITTVGGLRKIFAYVPQYIDGEYENEERRLFQEIKERQQESVVIQWKEQRELSYQNAKAHNSSIPPKKEERETEEDCARLDNVKKHEVVIMKKGVSPERFFEYGSQSRKKISGIYILYDRTNRKCYVGQSKDVIKRVAEHFTGHSNSDTTGSAQVYAAYKRGHKFFIVIQPLNISRFRSLDEQESFYIAKCDAYRNGYNKTSGNNYYTKKLNPAQLY